MESIVSNLYYELSVMDAEFVDLLSVSQQVYSESEVKVSTI